MKPDIEPAEPTACIRGRSWNSPRLAWQLANGPIRPGRRVCHHCDGRPCINVAHLYLTSAKKAERERDGKRGRHAGEQNRKHKLTESQVLDIRAKWASGSMNMHALGRTYGVSPQNVWLVVTGRTWRHLLEAT